MIGQTVSHYRILEKLGEGGMGVVYKAEDTKLERPVALKFLPSHLLSSDVDRQRFINEAHTAARLSHTGICTIYDIETVGDKTFIAMEYIPGQNLAGEIAAGPLDADRAAEIALDLCGALREAHSAGVVHRDIKPSNVMISDKRRTVLLDFGVARLKGDSKLTRTGTTIGTSGYMSPEQVRGEAVDHRTDIWSLGVVLYQMLTGSLPFKADHEAAVLYAIANEDPQPISDVRPNVPTALQKIVERALEKRVPDRYQNIDALQADLEVFLGKHEGKTTPASVRLGVEDVRRRRLIRGAWAVLLLLAVVAAGVWLWPRVISREKSEALRPVSVPEKRPAASAAANHRESIAVLPLANMSAESGSEFFADGMTEEIITQLARIKALKVISRTSVMQYKNTTKRLPQVASELGVAKILEGSVLRAGDRVRISVQLIDGTKDEHLWAESYEGDLADVLALQRNVAKDVAAKIDIELTPDEARRLAASTVVNKRAYDLYLQGRYQWGKRTPDGIRSAIGCYEQALAIDRGFALAYAGIAEAYAIAVSWAYAQPREACAMAREMANKALALDPDLAAVHAILGAAAGICDWDWDAAERHLTRAIELNPGDTYAHLWYAQHLSAIGRFAEAATEARMASDLDPLSVNVSGAVAVVLAENDEFAAAKNLVEKAESLDPESAPLYYYKIAVYHRIGEKEEAARAAIRFGEIGARTDRERRRVNSLREVLDKNGLNAFNTAMVDYLEQRDAEGQFMGAFYIAMYFAQVGAQDSALVWLERSFERREGVLHMILASADLFGSCASDPRYLSILERMGLPFPKQDPLR